MSRPRLDEYTDAPSVLLAVKVPADTAAAFKAYAKAGGKTASALLRELIDKEMEL